jgi:hypothetical protein
LSSIIIKNNVTASRVAAKQSPILWGLLRREEHSPRNDKL